ncbi:hypothetical protein H106_07774 [Trichophyton rubrum CBS 735.88]|nr:hypothetical protein H106_07774 [Trichophyton rubrum CBS 735.88]
MDEVLENIHSPPDNNIIQLMSPFPIRISTIAKQKSSEETDNNNGEAGSEEREVALEDVWREKREMVLKDA